MVGVGNWWYFHQGDYDVEWTEVTDDWAMYAVQGPKSRVLLEQLTKDPVADLKFFAQMETELQGIPCLSLRSVLELIALLCGVAILRRRTAKENVLMAALAVALAVILHVLVPIYLEYRKTAAQETRVVSCAAARTAAPASPGGPDAVTFRPARRHGKRTVKL